ncbi:S-formylglutathione hydrolase [Halobacteriovorax sp. ZH4_bin.1]|uniref:S-formylglutathione hydrolase n=1 Tax=unclassified Halobacteriovorax TaxID=2639665 RepID=UPI003723F436
MKFEKLKSHKSFGGETAFCLHTSKMTKTDMKFSYFKPATDKIDNIIIWLSGLTCTEENFITKAGAQAYLADSKTMIVCPDTSPRGLDLPGEHDSYDFGSGAGFYLNATTEGYKDHYKMYEYIVSEFMPMLKESFGDVKLSITGHSMGGHGALVIGLNNPELFHAISAFSPIVNPTQVPWGKKAFTGYLGDNEEDWKQYDACELIRSGKTHPKKILIEQGLADEFFEEQLRTKNFEDICADFNQELIVNYREGYDHSYYFIASFFKDHLKHLIS